MATRRDDRVSAKLDGELPERFNNYRDKHDFNKTDATRELLRAGLDAKQNPDTRADGGTQPTFFARMFEWCAQVSLLFAIVTGIYGVILDKALLVETTGFAIGTVIFGLAYMAEHGWGDVERSLLTHYQDWRAQE